MHNKAVSAEWCTECLYWDQINSGLVQKSEHLDCVFNVIFHYEHPLINRVLLKEQELLFGKHKESVYLFTVGVPLYLIHSGSKFSHGKSQVKTKINF